MTMQHDPSDGVLDLDDWMTDGGDGHDIDPRRRRVRRWWAAGITTVVLLAVIGAPTAYVVWALSAPLPEPITTTETMGTAALPATALALPDEGAAAISVSGADAYLGASASGIWATSGTNDPRPLASISKLITALVILDAHPLGPDEAGPTLTFDKADSDLYDDYYVLGATIAAMPTGSSMSLRDALSTMLIPSASNYADAVSTWAFGSRNAFVSATRSWLDANGLTGTRIFEPTGIDARNVSTPSDLIAIGKLAAANPVVARISGTKFLSLPTPGGMSNTNDLLGVAGVTGLKTGNLGEGRFNLLYTARIDVGEGTFLDITGVALGGTSEGSVDAGVIALLDSIHAGFHSVPLAEEGQEIGTFTTPWGSSAGMVIGESASIFTWSDTPITVAVDTTTPTEYAEGEVVGSVTWTAGPHTETAPLVIQGSIEPPTEWWRLTNPDRLG